MAPLTKLDAWDSESGCRNKLKYDPDQQLFGLNKVLPSGMAFPYDFGFIPSTAGDDGDPLDVLVLMDEPVPAGCKVLCRLVGVIEGEQTSDGETERNDRSWLWLRRATTTKGCDPSET
jgi:inorganic pyrophosphatase